MNTKQVNSLIGVLALTAVAMAVLVLMFSIQAVRAQTGGDIYVYKQLGRTDPVVHVGEYLTFTILIRNDTTFTVTTLPLVDVYNNAVLGYADAAPPPDSVDEGTGQLDWNDLTTAFGDLAPGQQIVIVVGFIAEHPETEIVNAAEVHDALGTGGVLSGTTSIISNTESVGGSSPVEKKLLDGLIPQAGQPLTFMISITNDGYTTMTVAPLVDTFDPTWLAFSYAVPPPDMVDTANGVLTWTDVTNWSGDIAAHGTVSVLTVFTALMAIDNTSNYAEVAYASDWYSNDLDGGADQVPITIIVGPTATPVPTVTPSPVIPTQPTPTQPTPTQPTPTQPTPTRSTSTPAPTPTATATSVILLLPETGQSTEYARGNLLATLLVLGMGGIILIHACSKRKD